MIQKRLLTIVLLTSFAQTQAGNGASVYLTYAIGGGTIAGLSLSQSAVGGASRRGDGRGGRGLVAAPEDRRARHRRAPWLNHHRSASSWREHFQSPLPGPVDFHGNALGY
jgi:hypothetical protein